ncbi:MAG: site-specific DNA-methyltransferase, partial [Bacteroidales bacterium]|nr:site-specific DNA-methyltransferase [Bacteroidales bacterium]
IYFEYRPDPEKSGQEGIWQKKLNEDAVKKIIESLDKNYKNNEFSGYFKIAAPTETQKNRILLEKYIGKYTARNTSDYFIHKNLKEFLNRELDFYIKNEVMWLDDIENADAPQVESYLAKIKVIRKIAHKIIEFLAQLEEFQKKLWLKKKFVVETNYCITLDKIFDLDNFIGEAEDDREKKRRESIIKTKKEILEEIVHNHNQHEEWIKLFAIDKIKPGEGDMHEKGSPGYSKPLKVEFLKANNNLVLDTKFFDEKFKSKLLASIDNFDEQCYGLLIHSENFQALNLLQERYRKQVKCVYIDPPYNTDGDGFCYKDCYRHSTWLTMIQERIVICQMFLNNLGNIFVSLDDNEHANFSLCLNKLFNVEKPLANFLWKKKGTSTNVEGAFVSALIDYIVTYGKSNGINPRVTKSDDRQYPFNDNEGFYRTTIIEKKNTGSYRRDTMQFEIIGKKPREGKRWQIGESTARELEQKKRFILDGNIVKLKIYKQEEEDTYSANPNLLLDYG